MLSERWPRRAVPRLREQRADVLDGVLRIGHDGVVGVRQAEEWGLHLFGRMTDVELCPAEGHGRISAALPDRRALFGECRRAFAGVLARRQAGDQVVLAREGRRVIEALTRAQHLLCRHQREWSVLRDAPREPDRNLRRLALGINLVDVAPKRCACSLSEASTNLPPRRAASRTARLPQMRRRMTRALSFIMSSSGGAGSWLGVVVDVDRDWLLSASWAAPVEVRGAVACPVLTGSR